MWNEPLPRELEWDHQEEKTEEMKEAVIASGTRMMEDMYLDLDERDLEAGTKPEEVEWPSADGIYTWEYERGFVQIEELEF